MKSTKGEDVNESQDKRQIGVDGKNEIVAELMRLWSEAHRRGFMLSTGDSLESAENDLLDALAKYSLLWRANMSSKVANIEAEVSEPNKVTPKDGE